MQPTRRERIRAETVEQIKRAALEQIAADGAPALSLRAVARRIGMSPAGLYRYYDGRDALITDLLIDAYSDLAAAVEEATRPGAGDPLERLASGVRSYRRWAVTYPNRFLLIFGTPIPGYAAPQDGPTVEANQRIGRAFLSVAADAIRNGLLASSSVREPTPGEEGFAASIHDELGLDASMIGPLLGTWAHWHGLVSLEVTHQLDWIHPEGGDAFFDAELDRMIEALRPVSPRGA